MSSAKIIIGIWICLFALATSGAEKMQARAEESFSLLRENFREMIEGQMAAFGRDDGLEAFGFASPTIQSIFETPEAFMEMVRSAYQPVYRPQSVDFLEPEATQQGWNQPVIVVGPDGRTYLAIYEMQRQKDGSWKINGCQITPLPQESV